MTCRRATTSILWSPKFSGQRKRKMPLRQCVKHHRGWANAWSTKSHQVAWGWRDELSLQMSPWQLSPGAHRSRSTVTHCPELAGLSSLCASVCGIWGQTPLRVCVGTCGWPAGFEKARCLSYPSFHSLVAFLLPVAPHCFGGKTMEVGRINFENAHFLGRTITGR